MNQYNRYANAFYEVILFCIITAWLPFKSLYYLIPFIAVVWFILRSNSGYTLIRLVSLLGIYVLVVTGYYIFYSFYYDKYVLPASVVSLLTYSSFVFLIVMPSSVLITTNQMKNLYKLIVASILVEGIIGVIQYIIVASLDYTWVSVGDLVQGTVGFLSVFNPNKVGFGGVIYAILMTQYILFATPQVLINKKGYIILIIGVIALCCTITLHVILSLIIAIVLTSLLFQKASVFNLNNMLKAAMSMSIFLILFAVISPNNFKLTLSYVKSYSEFKSLKIIATGKTVVTIPSDNPYSIVIGLGPGQYTSRAGLILSGKYLGGGKLNGSSFPPVIISNPIQKYALAEIDEYLTNPTYGTSTMSTPYYSYLSVLTEFGLPIFCLLLMGIVRYLFKLRKKYFLLSQFPETKMDRYYAFICASSIIFLCMISFFENYLEVPQAIFPGLLLLFLHTTFLNYRIRTLQISNK